MIAHATLPALSPAADAIFDRRADRRRDRRRTADTADQDPLSYAHRYLRRFGYSKAEVTEPTIVWPAVQSFRRFRGLASPTTYDHETLLETVGLMAEPRCGHVDVPSSNAVRTRRWRIATRLAATETASLTLRYRLLRDQSTNDVAGDGEWEAVRRALDTWERAVGVRFVETTGNEQSEFAVLWQPLNPAEPVNVLAVAEPPQATVAGVPRQLVFFDERAWTTTPPQVGRFDVESIALHEIGHILGLGHDDGGLCEEAVMCPTFTMRAKRELRQRDIDAFRMT